MDHHSHKEHHNLHKQVNIKDILEVDHQEQGNHPEDHIGEAFDSVEVVG